MRQDIAPFNPPLGPVLAVSSPDTRLDLRRLANQGWFAVGSELVILDRNVGLREQIVTPEDHRPLVLIDPNYETLAQLADKSPFVAWHVGNLESLAALIHVVGADSLETISVVSEICRIHLVLPDEAVARTPLPILLCAAAQFWGEERADWETKVCDRIRSLDGEESIEVLRGRLYRAEARVRMFEERIALITDNKIGKAAMWGWRKWKKVLRR